MPVISQPYSYNEEDLFVDLRSTFGRTLFLKCEGFNFAGSVVSLRRSNRSHSTSSSTKSFFFCSWAGMTVCCRGCRPGTISKLGDVRIRIVARTSSAVFSLPVCAGRFQTPPTPREDRSLLCAESRRP